MTWIRAGAVFLLLVSLAVVPWLLSPYDVGILVQVMIYAIFAMSLDLLLGYTGLPSLGHAAYFGLAGYAVALISTKLWTGAALAPLVVAGLAVTGAAGIFFALLALRTHGVYFLMITLALAQVLWGIAFKWRSLTGGDDGLPGIRRPELAFGLSLADPTIFYFAVLLAFVLITAFLHVLVRSPFGLALKGIRDSESRMLALGYNVWLHKLIIFVLAALMAGIAGMLFTFYNHFVSPSDLSLVLSAKVLLMVTLGGAGTLYGPILGAFAIVMLENMLSAWTERWLLLLGLLYVASVTWAPNGIVGFLAGRPGAQD
ncbi:MAG TPA: branched-chain amino acid ABC transporter permease [Candidatus Acidoferrales bacterium]|nr:branched-chain amino acid ABC transporter permease [Candidatus Acidoferrales bacterium]